MKTRDMSKRESRVIARGETSGHSHIITGDCEILETEEEQGNKYVIVKAGKNCAIKHLLEQPFVEEGKEVWTKEHTDIPLKEGNSYRYIQQVEFNPYEQAMRNVRD